jgi:CHAD domain-containing protein
VAFQLHRDESVRRGLRRLARKQLRAAREQIVRTSPPDDDAIHETRKSLKKIRAIFDLVNADDGAGVGGDRKRLRKINKVLSSLRDADAMLETLTTLRKRDAEILNEHAFARIRRELDGRKAAALEAAQEDGAWDAVERRLRELRRSAGGWRPAHRQARALEGIRDTYRNGQRAMARAQRRQRAEDFHEWRKQLKTLWYQLRLVEPAAPWIRRDVRALHQAERWLGEDHNVAVLCEELRDGSFCDFDRLTRAASRYQGELRLKTIGRVRALYAATPKEFLRKFIAAVDLWQHSRSRRRPRGSSRAA